MYVGDKNQDPSKEKKEEEAVAADASNGESPTESAAITMAKQAAKTALIEGVNNKDKDPKKSVNLELEQSADMENAQRLADLENNS